MRRILVAAASLAIAMFSAGGVAHAYPIGDPTTGVQSGSVLPGGSQTVTADNFCPNATVTFVLNPGNATLGTATADGEGHASITFSVPGKAGTYTVTASAPATCRATGGTDTSVASFSVAPKPPLPATGSDTNSLLRWGLAALLVGGLFTIVALQRRRRPATV
jgi:LPXTG-motif cell wall-anchored protein